MTDRPPILSYDSPQMSGRLPDPYAGWKFALGGGVGIAIGALGFGISVAQRDIGSVIITLLLTPTVLLLTSIVLVVPRTTRMVGAGMFCVTGIALLLLLALCAR